MVRCIENRSWGDLIMLHQPRGGGEASSYACAQQITCSMSGNEHFRPLLFKGWITHHLWNNSNNFHSTYPMHSNQFMRWLALSSSWQLGFGMNGTIIKKFTFSFAKNDVCRYDSRVWLIIYITAVGISPANPLTLFCRTRTINRFEPLILFSNTCV